ncbi:hypothetical protein FNJ84_11360 [Paracoccus sp. M683]|uniref:hypothetical protein n=1 Tax=Paracoccus sp. M683 TaxID=2594268 RepID=UPI00117E67CC|nr:hypothetical protein [Paracoccus sp. M683]TRW96672.1 hypothetical protein FNJ84_11360 [Paracoccus sp. M683]
MLVNENSAWLWRREGREDVAISHNKWAGTPDTQDVPRLVPVLQQLDALVATARDALAERKYAIWAEAWRYDYEPLLTAREFAARFVFEGIGYPDAQSLHSHFSLAFDDDGLFAGHGFFVRFTLSGELEDVEMFG